MKNTTINKNICSVEKDVTDTWCGTRISVDKTHNIKKDKNDNKLKNDVLSVWCGIIRNRSRSRSKSS